MPEHQCLGLVALGDQVLELRDFGGHIHRFSVRTRLNVAADIQVEAVGRDLLDLHDARELLGVGKAVMKPVWNGKEFAPRLMLPLSLSYDHRVIDGAEAARFNAYLASVLADFRRVSL